MPAKKRPGLPIPTAPAGRHHAATPVSPSPWGRHGIQALGDSAR